MKIIKDTLPLMIKQVTDIEKEVARKNNIPLFKGSLFKIVDDFGTEIKINDNTVVMGGALTALEHLFGVEPSFKPETLNSIYGVNNTLPVNEQETYIKVYGAGIGGSELSWTNIIPPSFKQKNIIDMIPFRVTENEYLDADIADKYYFRKQMSDGRYGWFLKEFEKEPKIEPRWKNSADSTADGELITSDISESKKTNLIECYGECRLKIEPMDFKEYFEYYDDIGLKMARYNTFGLFTAQKVFIDKEARYDYINTRLFSVVTFDNVSAKENKEDIYIYRVYGSI